MSATVADTERPAWTKWVTRIGIVFGLGALAVTVYLVGPRTILEHLGTIGWWFAALVAIDVGMSALDAAALHALTRGDSAPSYGRVLVAELAGRAANAVTPGGNLGEVLTAGILSERTKSSRIVAALIYCNLASLCISLILIAIGAPLTAVLMSPGSSVQLALVIAGVVAAGVVAVIVVLVRRGALSSLVGVAARLRLVSGERQKKWRKTLDDIDERLSGRADPAGRVRATIFVLISKTLGWFATWLTVAAAGYFLSVPELTALLSAGVVLGWISTLIPMGLGIAEGGNYGLFVLIGAPAELGVSLALARRVMQILSAAIGFSTLGLYRLALRARRKR